MYQPLYGVSVHVDELLDITSELQTMVPFPRVILPVTFFVLTPKAALIPPYC